MRAMISRIGISALPYPRSRGDLPASVAGLPLGATRWDLSWAFSRWDNQYQSRLTDRCHRTVKRDGMKDEEADARAINAQPWEPPPGMIKRQCPHCRYFFAAPSIAWWIWPKAGLRSLRNL